MSDEPRKPRWLLWATTVLLLLPLLYALSIGPSYWLGSNGVISWRAAVAYGQPVGWVVDRCPCAVRDAMFWYAGLWVDLDPFLNGHLPP